jgi:hypothetical protein
MYLIARSYSEYTLNNEKQFFNKENKTVTEEKVVDDKKIVFKLETFDAFCYLCFYPKVST